MENPRYLGDGVYASTDDMGRVVLTTGHHEPARAADGREVLVSMTSKYKQPTDLALLTGLLGQEKAERFLKPSFKLEINSDKIPQAQQQQVVNALVTVLETFGCADALSAKESVAPIAEFHAARHAEYTAEENMRIENVMPMTVAVKTKGRK